MTVARAGMGGHRQVDAVANTIVRVLLPLTVRRMHLERTLRVDEGVIRDVL